MIGIYKVKNIIENKIYIGQSKDLEKRKRSFFNFETKRYGGRLIDIKRQEYNKSEFWEYNILTTCNKDDLNKLEQFFIKQYNSNKFKNGYNISGGGKGNCGIKLSNETKMKISLKLKGRKFTNEHKIKMCGPRNLPKRKNGKVILSLDVFNGNVKKYSSITEACDLNNYENPSAITSACRGRQKTYKGLIWFYYNDYKDRNLRLKKINNVILKLKKSNIIVQIDKNTNKIINEFNSISDIVKYFNFKNSTNISNTCRYIQNSAYGFIWRYKDLII